MGICSSELKPINPTQIDLSHFEVGITLGRGGYGKVHAVQDRVSGQWFALKRLSKARIISQHSLTLIWQEREVMKVIRRANCPFLCSLIYAFQDDKEIFMVTQFMSGMYVCTILSCILTSYSDLIIILFSFLFISFCVFLFCSFCFG